MHILVTPMRRQGSALTSQERRRYPAIRGNVIVNSENNAELGRSTNVARVDWDASRFRTLPRLLDATLAGMAVTRVRP